MKNFILRNIEKKWKDNRCKLYHEYYDPIIGREANLAKHPVEISQDQWASFIDYRAHEKIKEIESGQLVSRGLLYIATHKKKDGSFVNEGVRTISGMMIRKLMTKFLTLRVKALDANSGQASPAGRRSSISSHNIHDPPQPPDQQN
ncbi:uncharacterized protein LOC127804982 isoform X1 [Diospyros lotus]|uniref:uncharacterized protein LOC127804982 isoform X1 n=1 Tax=Diospyros lotus TaxID=55363 RepID=UPI00225A96DC|nr:uncharacterized protein LOC127804982 isoform X1 [Diospyros lotus]XP_052198085.1 uncharacterized protein LOC127804982 isoform X1 [Diospyros lotus]